VRRLALACVLVLSACSGESAEDQRVGEFMIAITTDRYGSVEAYREHFCNQAIYAGLPFADQRGDDLRQSILDEFGFENETYRRWHYALLVACGVD
jgi:hypothetical protein